MKDQLISLVGKTRIFRWPKAVVRTMKPNMNDNAQQKRSTRHYERLTQVVRTRVATVVDVGIGEQGSPFLYEAFPDAMYFSIDPLAETLFEMDRFNVHGIRIPVGLSDWTGDVEIEVSAKRSRTSMNRRILPDMKSRSTEKRLVRITTLDAIYLETGFEWKRPSVLKIDVEGHEFRVLQGGRFALQHFDYIIVEVNFGVQFEEQTTASEITRFLFDNQFEIAAILKCGSNTADILYAHNPYVQLQ